MKTILAGALLASTLALAQTAPKITKTTTDQLRAAANAPTSSVYVMDSTGTLRFATLGPNLTLTCAGSGACSIDSKQATPAPTIPARRLETASVSAAMATFTLASPWTVELDVQRNGLELTEGLDYTVAGQTITFVSSAQPQPGDTMRFKYR